MFYERINRIKVFNNREGFLWLFNQHAEMQIYSHVKPLTLSQASPGQSGTSGVALSELMALPDAAARRQRLPEAVIAETGLPAQSASLDRQDVYDTTGNILVDYTLFGYENAVDSEQLSEYSV
jgi:hypothetical protein